MLNINYRVMKWWGMARNPALGDPYKHIWRITHNHNWRQMSILNDKCIVVDSEMLKPKTHGSVHFGYCYFIWVNENVTGNRFVKFYEFWNFLWLYFKAWWVSLHNSMYCNFSIMFLKLSGLLAVFWIFMHIMKIKITFWIGLHGIIFTCIKRGQLPVFINQWSLILL